MSDSERPTVCVVADDLIWASRLVAAVENAGAIARRTRPADLGAHAAESDLVVIDLNGRAYDGLALVEQAARSRPTVAVGQHEDVELRRRALAAGARQVYSYNRMFREGPTLIAKLLAAEPAAAGRR